MLVGNTVGVYAEWMQNTVHLETLHENSSLDQNMTVSRCTRKGKQVRRQSAGRMARRQLPLLATARASPRAARISEIMGRCSTLPSG